MDTKIYLNIIDDLIDKINNIEGYKSNSIKNLIIQQIKDTQLDEDYDEIDEEIERLQRKKTKNR